jgi:hypothetical protein
MYITTNGFGGNPVMSFGKPSIAGKKEKNIQLSYY